MRGCVRLLRNGAFPTRPTVAVPTRLRAYSTANKESSQESATAALSPRWLSDTRSRIGKCILFGLQPHQTEQAGQMLQEIACDWRDLSAGSEGFLTSSDRAGLLKQEVVWGEMDSMGHVNNVMYNRYAESGRVNWTHKLARIDPAHAYEWKNLLSPKGVGLILRKITTEFKFPMKWPDRISVYHKLQAEPTESTDAFVLDVLITSELHQRPAARLIEDVVVYDYPKSKKTPLPPFMVSMFKDIWRLQEEAKQKNSERVRGLLKRVEELEKSSWDKEGATESLGSAAG